MHFNLHNLLRCFRRKQKYHELLKIKFQRTVQEHWPKDPFCLEYLICESWEPKTENGLQVRKYTYIVFVDNELDIDWITAEDSSVKNIEQISLATALESIPHKHLPRCQIIAFKNLIGNAIVSFFEDHPENAKKLMIDAKQYVNDRNIECSRRWALEIATFFVLLLIIIGGIFSAFEYSTLSENPSYFWILSCFWAFVGSYLSIVRKVGSEKLNSSSGFRMHFLQVSTRMLSGGLLGIIAFFILKSALLCPPVFDAFKDTSFGFSLFGFIAGFFEQFIPNIITSVQNGEQYDE